MLSLSSMLAETARFHDQFRVGSRAAPGLPPHPARHLTQAVPQRMRDISEFLGQPSVLLRDDVAMKRLHLLQEELSELAQAVQDQDLVAALDALCDLQYVLLGTVLLLGLQDVFEEAWLEVHHSNMTKSHVGEAGRVVKGPDYRPPRLGHLVNSSPEC